MAKQPAGPAMTLGNMRDLGVKRLIASCLNPACRDTALIECGAIRLRLKSRTSSLVWSARNVGHGNKIDVRPNWKEQTPKASLTGKEWR